MIFRLALLFVLALAGPASSQVRWGIFQDNGGAVVASYTGPGDVVSGAVAWYGLRAYNNTLANSGASTTKIADLRGATSGSCTLFLKGNGTGDADLTTAGAGGIGNQCLLGATTFCTVTNSSCLVSKLYDQSGANSCSGAVACDVSNSTGATQPQLVFNCINTSLPCIQFNQSAQLVLTAAAALTSPQAQPYTFAFAAERDGQFTFQGAVIIAPGSNGQAGYWTSANQVYLFAGTGPPFVTVSDSAFHVLQTVFNSTNSNINVDGTSNTGLSAGTDTATGNLTVGSASGAAFLQGKLLEVGMWPGSVTTLCNNMFNYWQTSVSC